MDLKYIGNGAWGTSAGGIVFRWYDTEFAKSLRRCVWDQLQDVAFVQCPRCGYRWQPRDIKKAPKCCTLCKQYMNHIRAPLPDDWEPVHPDVWHDAKYGLHSIHSL